MQFIKSANFKAWVFILSEALSDSSTGYRTIIGPAKGKKSPVKALGDLINERESATESSGRKRQKHIVIRTSKTQLANGSNSLFDNPLMKAPGVGVILRSARRSAGGRPSLCHCEPIDSGAFDLFGILESFWNAIFRPPSGICRSDISWWITRSCNPDGNDRSWGAFCYARLDL